MHTHKLTRRGFLQCSGASVALATLGSGTKALAQFPRPAPLEDKRVSLVMTTEAKPWLEGTVYQPTFSWELLNLNIDPNAVAEGEHATMLPAESFSTLVVKS